MCVSVCVYVWCQRTRMYLCDRLANYITCCVNMCKNVRNGILVKRTSNDNNNPDLFTIVNNIYIIKRRTYKQINTFI